MAHRQLLFWAKGIKKMKTNKFDIAIILLLLFILQQSLSAQDKDSLDYKYWDSVITNESVQSDTEAIKNQRDELFNDLGISYSKDKIVLVKKNLDQSNNL